MNEGWNKSLKKIIRREMGDEAYIEKKMHPLLDSISDAFDSHDKEYALLNRIMDLSSSELFEANNELRKRNEELDRFVYSTSHDLRAPLTSIMGLLNLMELTDSNKDKEKYLQLMRMSTVQLDLFIQEIVAYTHNKKLGVQSELIDFEDLIEKCISRLSFMNNSDLIRKVVDVKLKFDFYSDRQRLDNLLSNLLSNAIKYCDLSKQDPLVRIVVKSENNHAIIIVEDNGIGIKNESQDRVFEMFYRASAQSKGSGIGLYIVKEIVEKLAGSIKVKSTLGEGTTFEIDLPNQKG
ncbi:Signal transduction histidine kinase [Ekhidna lutea]|uniref:histidine kinase n=1 Tax=Ekhidna lutea TaxID=447679 RepID=A0A239FJH4_EKHLU|nr:HAMP domain-containing sensor histidine kinase [Ekhidna lutea]SNS57089.1 Signal transduction histidine kinase [Ekhidna lutea]